MPGSLGVYTTLLSLNPLICQRTGLHVHLALACIVSLITISSCEPNPGSHTV